jgi:cytochrome c553
MLLFPKVYNLRLMPDAAGRMNQPLMSNQERGEFSMKLPTLIAALGLVAATGAAQAADPNLARNLAATCANCHGTNGRAVPNSGMDALAGEDKVKTLKKLNDFKTGVKPASIMHQITKGYTEQQLDLIAGYFAAQK